MHYVAVSGLTAEARPPRPRLHTVRHSSMSGHGNDEEPAAKRPRKEDHRPKRVIAFCKPTEEPYGKFSNYYRQPEPFTFVVPVGSKKMACLSSEPPGPAHSSRRCRPEKKTGGSGGGTPPTFRKGRSSDPCRARRPPRGLSITHHFWERNFPEPGGSKFPEDHPAKF